MRAFLAGPDSSAGRLARGGHRVPDPRGGLQRRGGRRGPGHHRRATCPLPASSRGLRGCCGAGGTAARAPDGRAPRAPVHYPVSAGHPRPCVPRRNLPLALVRRAHSSAGAANARAGGDGAATARRGTRPAHRLVPA